MTKTRPRSAPLRFRQVLDHRYFPAKIWIDFTVNIVIRNYRLHDYNGEVTTFVNDYLLTAFSPFFSCSRFVLPFSWKIDNDSEEYTIKS